MYKIHRYAERIEDASHRREMAVGQHLSEVGGGPIKAELMVGNLRSWVLVYNLLSSGQLLTIRFSFSMQLEIKTYVI